MMMSFNFKLVLLVVFLLFGSSVATRGNVLKSIVEKEEENVIRGMLAKEAIVKAWEREVMNDEQVIRRAKAIELADALLGAVESKLNCLKEDGPCLVKSHCCGDLRCIKTGTDPIGTCAK